MTKTQIFCPDFVFFSKKALSLQKILLKNVSIFHTYTLIGGMPEVDFLYNFDGQMIPVEIKSGKSGKMRSLLQFLDMSEISVAVRFYAGQFQIEEHKTLNGKPFKLINIPYFLAGKLREYLVKNV